MRALPPSLRTTATTLGAGLLAATLCALPAAAAGSSGSSEAAEPADDTFTAPTLREADAFAAPGQLEPGLAEDDPSTGQGAGSAPADDEALPRPTGLGAETFAQVPEETTQLVVVSGEDPDSTDATLTYWEKTEDGWTAVRSWEATNGENGWREDRREGDKTTPAGVFSLSDAAGYLDDPGTELPYHQDAGLRSGAEAVYGDGYERVFDYVIAVDYNRRTGVAPMENTRPEGWDKGGKIWLHVEHSSPTRGCVSMAAEDLEFLLTELTPDSEPQIAMGDAAFLAQ